MPEHHAVLGPSAASRWIQCPASVRLAAEVPSQPGNFFTAEGTKAHAIAELAARENFYGLDMTEAMAQWEDMEPAEADLDEMRRHAWEYVGVLEGLRAQYGGQVLLEQRMDTGIPGCWGTSDAVLVSPTHVGIVDYKYGQGVRVEAEDNPQTMLYGLGALNEFDLLGDIVTVSMTIHQPRLGHTSTVEMSAVDLRAWGERVRPVAAEALAGSDRFGPGEKACRWCPVAGRCTAQADYITRRAFAPPETLTPEQVAEHLGRLKEIRAWCDALEAGALNDIYSQGKPIPGWKVVLSGGRRGYTDPELVVHRLIDHGYGAEQVARFAPKPIGELEKLMGKTEFASTVGDLVKKSEGKPSLAPESDKRPSADPMQVARDAFS